jgi:parallel beta-helix repeat protein
VGGGSEDTLLASYRSAYKNMSGTSMATPHVSGLAALISSVNPTCDYLALKNVIMNSVDKLGSLENKVVTDGRINAYKAVTATPSTMQMLIHSPGNSSYVSKNRPLELVISLSDGVNPKLGATVNVNFDDGESTIELKDDGIGVDQKAGDGYYAVNWVPTSEGKVTLSISAQQGIEIVERSITVHVVGETRIISNWINGGNGIVVGHSLDAIIDGNTLYNSRIDVSYSSYINVQNNYVYISTGGDGIYLFYSTKSTISSNSIQVIGGRGLSIQGSLGNYIDANSIADSTYGIRFEGANDNIITNNTLSNNKYGIYLGISMNNTFKNNVLLDNGFVIEGYNLEDWNNHLIDISNTVNGLPIYYLKNQDGGTIPGDAGQVILANCTGIFIAGLELSNCTNGIQIGFSSNNTISDNYLAYNSLYGVCLYNSTQNIILNNTITSNGGYGIYLYRTINNRIYHNNFINNVQQAYAIRGVDTWNDSYPSGGNFWSDYVGEDLYSGPNQDVPGSDEIGDIPYNIVGWIGNLDRYPLMIPWTP